MINNITKTNYNLKQSIRQQFARLRVCYDTVESNGRLLVRCPFCGDSSKDTRHAHFCVFLDLQKLSVPGFDCKRCGAHGAITKQILGMFELDSDDADLDVLFKKSKIEYGKNAVCYGFKENKVIAKIPEFPLNNKASNDKIKYIEERLGIKITREKIQKYRLVLNPIDFLKFNKVKTLTRKEYWFEEYDRNYLCVLTTNCEFLNGRNIYEPTKYHKRYENYDIFGITDNTKKYYFIHNEVDYIKDVELVLAEGYMDIISVFENEFNCNDEQRIFGAGLGLSYESLVRFLIKKGILFINNIIIYADKTEPLLKYKQLKESIKDVFYGDVEVRYNMLSKDCGVPKDKIKIKSYKV